MSKLYFRYGAMNCGKSAALMQVAHNYEENNMKILVIKSSIDTKAEDKLSSRIGLERKVDILLDDKESLIQFYSEFKKSNCILVDEAQFLNKNQVDELWYVSKMFDIPVICYGLRTNFKGELFPGSERLLALSDELEELITICSCGKRAKFNARYVNDKFTVSGEDVVIDGSNSKITYKPICGKCYILEKKRIEG